LGLERRGWEDAREEEVVTEETSATVLPIRVILWVVREESGREGSLKGGRRRPSLETMNFWLAEGTQREEAISSER